MCVGWASAALRLRYYKPPANHTPPSLSRIPAWHVHHRSDNLYDRSTQGLAGPSVGKRIRVISGRSALLVENKKDPVTIQPIQIHAVPVNEPALTLRQARVGDIDAIFTLIDEASHTSTVLPQSREILCERLRDFLVADCSGEVVGCGALSLFTPTLAEIRSLVVAQPLRSEGLGGRIVDALLREAQCLGVRRVFALTAKVSYFERLGFKRVEKASLPQKVWTECIHCPKYLDCQEDAVDMILEPDEPGTLQARDRTQQ